MDLRDLIVTPFLLLFVCVAAYLIRPRACDSTNYQYFFPALAVKVIGALAVGFIYQFYYNGGDTFNYHTHGSRVIWEIFLDDPLRGFRMIFLPTEWHGGGLWYKGYSQIYYYGDPASYFIVRVSAFIDLFTFSTYSSTAIVFAIIGFAGAWMMFLAFSRAYPTLIHWFAIAIFFLPSVFFWGSGILKDTIVMAALGMSVFLIQGIFIKGGVRSFRYLFLLMICFILIFQVKKYVLICFVPAAILWIYLENVVAIRSMVLKILLIPFVLAIAIGSGYFAVTQIGQGDSRYSINKLAVTAQITAYDIGFYSGRDAGSGYSLGELDGTFSSMLKLAPQAVNVSLFRPYLWEVKNPLMLMAALESCCLLVLTLYIFFRSPMNFLRSIREPYVLFCIAFAITFAFAVGVSTYNFGTLVRYKIPMLPFYVIGLSLIANYLNSARKRPAFDSTE